MRTSLIEYALLAAILFGVGTTVMGFRSSAAAREWEAQAKMELARAEAAQEELEVLLVVVAEVQENADSTAAVARELGSRVMERVADVRERAAPDPVAPVTVRDSIIDDLVLVVDTWEDAYEAEVKVSKLLRVTIGIQSVTLEGLTATLENRPTPRPRWIPSVSPGLFAGVCNDGRGCMGVGLTLSWRIQ